MSSIKQLLDECTKLVVKTSREMSRQESEDSMNNFIRKITEIISVVTDKHEAKHGEMTSEEGVKNNYTDMHVVLYIFDAVCEAMFYDDVNLRIVGYDLLKTNFDLFKEKLKVDDLFKDEFAQ